jgi:hypothetical protein
VFVNKNSYSLLQNCIVFNITFRQLLKQQRTDSRTVTQQKTDSEQLDPGDHHRGFLQGVECFPTVSYLRCLCGGVLFFFVLLPVSVDCPFLIASSVFSNVY